jgi:hypothetical protein
MPAFWIGIAMVAYDGLGHATCAVARLFGQRGAGLWNAYSRFIWPSIPNGLAWDIYWAAWHLIAIALIIVGYFTPARWYPDWHIYRIN